MLAENIRAEIKAMEGKVEERQLVLKELREKVQKEMDEAGPVLSKDQLHALVAQLEQDAVHWEQVIEETVVKAKETQKQADVAQLEVDKKKFEAETLEDKIKKLKEEIEAKNKPELTELAGAVKKSAFSGATLKASLQSEIDKLKADLEKEQASVGALRASITFCSLEALQNNKNSKNSLKRTEASFNYNSI